ncbi:MAG: O-antigen ligase family protein [Parcubacteria group bacterium]|nr:O-antigen ligase family protein [Parcubacteria group bacterium]
MQSWGIGFNEWNAAFLYFTDLLIIAVLGLWFLRHSYFYAISRKSDSQKEDIFFRLRRTSRRLANYDWFLVGFLALSAISIKNAVNPALGLYQLLKLAEFSFLYFYIKSNLGAVFNLTNLFFVFLASGIFQAILSIFQYTRQSDLGLRFLGETVLNPDLFNVAVFLINGEKIMRSYGTTPHPNVLALILFISIFIFYYLYASRSKFTGSKFGLVLYTILLFGFFFTFSRIIIFVWLIASLILFLRNRGLRHVKKLTFITIFAVVIFSILFWPEVLARIQISPQEEALSLRGFYNKIAFEEKPFFGVGPGNFVNWLKEFNPGLASNLYQPVHNIYLLIFSETGILGIALFLLFIFFLIRCYLKNVEFNRPFHYSLFILFASILFLGFFDHFLWTLQQGQIILWLVLGLMGARSSTG